MADLFGTYDKRIKLTIDHTKIDADLSWFPITVFLGNYGDAIDVGAAATNRGAAESAGFTIIAKNNPANSSGTITSVEIYAETNMDGVIVATFSADGNNITARDSYSIGSVTAGSKQTFEVELSVETGDYLGFYNSSGGISSDGTGGDGRWYKSGDYTDCVDEAFTSGAGTIYSIYATGFEKSQGTEVFTEFDADEDFDRIAFTSSDGETQLYADCELFDVSESKAIYHVSKTGWTVSSSADTDIYLYYSNIADHNTTYISKSGGTAAQSVWDSSFEAVYHMIDAVATATVKIDDDFEDGDITEYIAGADWAIATDQKYAGTYSAKCASNSGTDAADSQITRTTGTTPDYMEIELYWRSDFVYSSYPIRQYGNGFDFVFKDNKILMYNNGSTEKSLPIATFWSTDTWYKINVYFDFVNDIVIFWVDDVYKGTATDCTLTAWDGYNGGATYGYYNNNCWLDNLKVTYYDAPAYGIIDSTSNGNHGTKKAANEPTEATGQVGQGQDFDGSDDYIALGGAIVSTHPFTIEAIARINGTGPRAIISVGDKDVYDKYYYIGISNDKFALFVRNTSAITNLSDNTYNDSNFHYVVGTFVDNTEKNLYVDIADKKTITNSVAVPPIDATEAGRICDSSPSDYYNDVVDEIRISNSERSDAWIGATYSTLWDTLLTYGAEETSGEQKEGTCSIGIETQFNSVLSKGNIQQATLSIEISTDFTTALSKGKTENANSTIGIQTNFQSILSFGKTSEATITISGITDFSGVLSSGIVANATSSINLSALFVGNITYGIVQNAISTINSATLFVGALSKGVTGQATITIGITTLFDSILIGGKRKQAISNIGILALFESILDYGILQQAQTTIGINTQFDSLLNKGKTGNATIGIKIDSLFNSVLSKGKTENAITNIGIQTLFETELGRYKKAVSNINIATLFDTELSKGMIEQTSSKINILTLIESSLSKGIFQEATISVNTSTQFNSVLSNGIIVNGNSSIGISTDFSSVLEKGIIENASGTLNLDTLFSVDLNVIKKYSVSATIGITTSIESALSKGIIEDAVAVNSLNTQFNAELGVAGIKFATSNINILTSFNSTLKRGKTENCISSITLDTQFNAVLDSGKIEQAILDIGLNTDFVGIINNGITEQANATVNLNTDFDADITHYKLVQANEIIEIRTDFVSELSYGKLEQAISRINIATDYESLLKIYGEIRNGNASILIYTLFESDLSQQYKHSQAILGISSNQSKFEIQKIEGEFDIINQDTEIKIIE